jgi:tetratricopeptide (TPR) repeat protein
MIQTARVAPVGKLRVWHWSVTLLVLLAACLGRAAAEDPPKEPSPEERARLEKQAAELHERARALYGQGRYLEATKLMQEALEIHRTLYPKGRYPHGHPHLANSLNNLGLLLQARGEYGPALDYLQQALQMKQQLYAKERYPQGHPDLANSLGNLGSLLQAQGEYGQALDYYRQALQMNRQLYPKERYPQGHPDLAHGLSNLGLLLKEQGEFSEALDYSQQALHMYQQVYPKRRYPQGHPQLAHSLSGLGLLLADQGEYGQALDYLQQAREMYQQLYPAERYPQGHPHLAQSLDNLGGLLQRQGEYGKALDYFQQALRLYHQLYPKQGYPQGHPRLAQSLNNFGLLLQARGEYVQALDYSQQALHMFQQLYPKERYPQGHPHLANSLNNLGGLLQAQGEYGRALDYYQQALHMRQQLYPKQRYPQGHPELANSLYNLGLLLKAQGEYGQALDYLQQALQMEQQLYPKDRYPQGHPLLAHSLNNLGFVLHAQREDGQALDYLQQALQMRQQLYPKGRYPRGHPDLASSFNSLGALLLERGEYAKGLDYLRQALRMRQQLYPRERYPRGHPDLAENLNNLGALLEAQGEYDQALDSYEQALQMYRQLYATERYPQGHPHLARSLHNLGFLLKDRGEYGKALDFLQQALQMCQQLTRAFTESASEAEALNFLASLPGTENGYLSVAAEVKGASAAEQYALLWQGKASITGILARRQQLLRGITDDPTRARAEELLDVRRQLARLLMASADAPIKDREKRLGELTELKERLERDLARRLPDWQRRDTLARAPYTDLVQHLPPHAAFIDLLHYYHWSRDPKAKPTPQYVAFVLRPAQPVQRVDLGPAAPIEDALARWRRDLTNGLSSPDAAQLRRLVWDPLAAHLGPETDTVYLSPDGALHALPWAALPGRKAGSFLLEEYAMTLVPHGPFLLDQLTAPPRPQEGKDTLLAVGGVAYDLEAALQPDTRRSAERGKDRGQWPALPGTAKELEQVLSLARGAPGTRAVVERRGREAGTQRVWLDLPQARWAHLATHGFFAAPRTRERQALLREADFLWGVRGLERRGVGARNPLVQTGLVLAGANLQPGPDVLRDDRGILTGEAIAGLDLRRLDLAVLSACETGLGESASGEGVFGLQRAFHLGGCRTVVASLWKVDDEATAALMALFYHHLWAKGEPPLQALRHAQLDLLHHPDEVPLLAKARGSPFATVVKRVEAPAPPAERRATAPEKHWAAFVLSGLGR